jgi:hypothetical protein
LRDLWVTPLEVLELGTNGGLMFEKVFRRFRTCVQNNTEMDSLLDDPQRAMDNWHYANEENK